MPGWLAGRLFQLVSKRFPNCANVCEFLFQLCTTMEKMHGVAITRAMSVTQHMAGLEQTTLGLKSCQ